MGMGTLQESWEPGSLLGLEADPCSYVEGHHLKPRTEERQQQQQQREAEQALGSFTSVLLSGSAARPEVLLARP